jgi:CPA1 family monovalent cation:H+ antiporter
MYGARTIPRLLGPETRLQITATWTLVTFVLESLVFILVGLELPYVLRALDRLPLATLLGEAALVSLCVVAVRVVWIMPTSYAFRTLGRWLRHSSEPLPEWRSILFVAWAGLRGGDSLVLALSLPLTTAAGARFPARDQIVFITFCVIFITLVLQGPTLAPFARRLETGADEEDATEEAHARLAAAEAGLRTLEKPAATDSPYPEVVRYLKKRHRQRARRWAARDAKPHEEIPGDVAHDHITAAPSHDDAEIDEQRATEYRRVRGEMLDAEQRAVFDLRDKGVIADDVMRRILRDLDLETMLLDTSEPVSESVSEVPSEIGRA